MITIIINACSCWHSPSGTCQVTLPSPFLSPLTANSHNSMWLMGGALPVPLATVGLVTKLAVRRWYIYFHRFPFIVPLSAPLQSCRCPAVLCMHASIHLLATFGLLSISGRSSPLAPALESFSLPLSCHRSLIMPSRLLSLSV